MGELLDIIVIGMAGILWNQELSSREDNVQVIVYRNFLGISPLAFRVDWCW